MERSVTEGEKEIGFTFHIDVERPTKKGTVPWHQRRGKTLAEVSITLVEDTQQTGHAKNVTVKLLGGEISIDPSKEVSMNTPFFVNGKRYDPITKDHGTVTFQGDILPLIYFYLYQKDPKGTASWVQSANHWEDLPTQVIRRHVHSNTSAVTCRKIANRVPVGTVEEIEKALVEIPGPPSWRAVAQSGNTKSIAAQLHHALLVSHTDEIFRQVDAALRSYFQGVRYLKPLRATAERYYRKLDLSVSEIEADGSNLPMFLDSLSEADLKNFRSWVRIFLDVDAFPKRQGDQVMVMAQGKNDPKPFNIADMGFGISQVLPIAAQLWATTRPGSWTQLTSMVVLEQPELHLHPDSQARLADVFAGTIGATNPRSPRTPSILVETHSQHLVNRLGQLVESGRLAAEDVSIILFESSGGPSPSTKVRISSFSAEGVLQNWPYGFFEPEIE
ncbi:AAA family ATPase [Polaromonas sp. JS666]|uniref:AAA family ATPase n=1 Tax=Polaromonas sp. (strain JS666 / ATCC BAA-500) TaxID=296591 RepID=UPI0018DDEA6C|nr:AAA family ATPase [Polaromonas sp. JS666]